MAEDPTYTTVWSCALDSSVEREDDPEELERDDEEDPEEDLDRDELELLPLPDRLPE